jgi:hypothetical protein
MIKNQYVIAMFFSLIIPEAAFFPVERRLDFFIQQEITHSRLLKESIKQVSSNSVDSLRIQNKKLLKIQERIIQKISGSSLISSRGRLCQS